MLRTKTGYRSGARLFNLLPGLATDTNWSGFMYKLALNCDLFRTTERPKYIKLSYAVMCKVQGVTSDINNAVSRGYLLCFIIGLHEILMYIRHCSLMTSVIMQGQFLKVPEIIKNVFLSSSFTTKGKLAFKASLGRFLMWLGMYWLFSAQTT